MAEIESTDDRILDALSDDVGKRILTMTDQRAMSAHSLDEHCEASLATIYRRIEELLDLGLLREQTRVQADGNHYRQFESNLEHLAVTLDDGTLHVDVDRRDDAPDHFRTIWDAMQRGLD